MQVKWLFFLIQVTGIIVVFLWLDASFVAKAEVVSSVQTEVSIGLYGTYESESEPQPGPPDGIESIPPNEGITKPESGKLPQLGTILSHYWFWIGCIALLIALFQKRQTYWKTV